MPYHSPFADSADLLQRARDAIAHFRQIGVDLERGRFQRYERIIREVAEGSEVDRGELFNATCEINDLATACRLHPDILRMDLARMHLLGKGSDSYAQVSDSDRGRDIAFELVTASAMQACGAATTLNNPADVVCAADGRQLLIECKRPTSLGSLRRRLKEAHDQLAGHRDKGTVGIGAIAVDVSVLVNPECGVLDCETAQAGIGTLRKHMKLLRAKAMSAVQGYYRERPASDTPLVVALMFRMQCGLATGDALIVANTWDIEPIVNVNDSDFKVLYRIVQRHDASTPGIHTDSPSDRRLTPLGPR